MKRRVLIILALASVPFGAYLLAAETPAMRETKVPPTTTATSTVQVERGRYLVEKVAMCGQCHTPRNAHGEMLTDRWLEGAPIPVTAPAGYASWALVAPRIAGLGAFSDEEFVRLMTTGVNRDGRILRAPMPPFRMTPEDAQAIAAYLRALP